MPNVEAFQVAAQALGLQVLSLELPSPDELDAVLEAMTAGRADGLITVAAAAFLPLAPPLVDFAAQNRLPAMYGGLPFPRAGGLMGHGPNVPDNYRRAATYVDKILKGTKPADLPIERPTKFDFIINLKTAQALGLTIPQSVLQQATELVQ